MSIPPPRTAPARAPRQEGVGCGVFLVGMLVLAGVLGIVLLFSSGALDGLFSGLGSSPATSSPGGSGAQPTASPTSSPTPTPSPTPSPTPEPLVSVPDLSGLSGQGAEAALRQLQLIPVRQDESSATVPAGQVIRQAVAPGEQLRLSQPVTYTVSLGPQLVSVPDVAGAPAGIARQRVEAAGLAVAVEERASQSVDAGFVISQSPQPGLRLPAGETVQIVVSLGDVVRFPDVIGLDRDDAVRLLNTIPGLELIFVDAQGPDRLPSFESYRPNEVVSAALEDGRGLNNGELIPRGSRIVLGVRAP